MVNTGAGRARLLSRRNAILGTLAWTLAPAAARAVLPANPPSAQTMDVLDVGGFDPIVRRNADGKIARHNLVFRTLVTETERMLARLDDIQRVTLPELGFRWEPSAGTQSLTMYSAYVIEYGYVALSRQGRGQNYDEFLVAVESTHGTLRRREALQTLVADYRVTPAGGVIWNRYTD